MAKSLQTLQQKGEDTVESFTPVEIDDHIHVDDMSQDNGHDLIQDYSFNYSFAKGTRIRTSVTRKTASGLLSG